MIKQLRKIPVRRRIIGVALFVAFIFFFMSTPLLSWVRDVVASPREVRNLDVIATADSLRLTWDRAGDIDLTSIRITVGDDEIDLPADSVEFERRFDEFAPDSVTFSIRDRFSNQTDTVISLTDLQTDDIVTDTYNEFDSSASANRIVISSSIAICLILFIGTIVVFGVEIEHIKTLVLTIYPTVIILPYAILSFSFLVSERGELNKLILSFIFSLLVYLIGYFLLLTVNILNTSIRIIIPLAQAARASQFIFSLISSYVILILFFGANYSFFEKTILILPNIFFVTFSTILMLEHITYRQAIIRSGSITITILYAIFVLSIWPTSYVYAILAIAVCYYILLSIALEFRQKLNRYIWIEYSTLVFLITFLLIINSSWGINGTLL
jgi:hypothetical protein